MSIETLTWTEFLQEAKQFIKISDHLADTWTLIEKNKDEANAYLVYKQKLKCALSDTNETCCELLQLEYHIIYSISYQVPVLYFQAQREDGSLLDLEASWHIFRDAANYKRNDMLSILTQMDHPILFRPFLALHPCRTAQLLAQFEGTKKSSNRILTFISLMGPFVRLNLANEYGMEL